MSFFGGTGFGAPAASSPFGQTQPTNVFGQPNQPAFGATPTPAFGAASASGFGSTAFGAATGSSFAFNAASSASSLFGAGSSPAFGATPGSTFGAPPQNTTASPFGGGGSLFAQSQPGTGFGGSPTPAFGSTGIFGQPAQQATSGFGAPAAPSPFGQPQASTFGAAPSFGSPGGFGGGAAATAGRGTRGVPWRKTQEQDGAANGPKTTVYLNSISCMPEYANKSVEELRREDYEDGCKGGAGAPAAGSGMFGAAPASAPSVFGAASAPAFGSQSPSPFGGGGFGVASTPAFGQAASSPAFGSTSVFGGAPQQQTSAFGATSTFGTTQAPAFGAAASAPAFGGFGTPAASAPAFGGFGAPPAASAPAFGGFGAASAPAFGAAAPAAPSPFGGFGAAPANSSPTFGAPAAAPSPFGAPATGGSLFGGAATQSAFGGAGGGSLFGGTPASTPAFGAAPASTPAFGAPGSGGSLFGGGAAASTPAFGTGGSLFGGAAPAASAPATGGFSFAAPGAAGQSAPAPSLFGGTSTGSLFGGGGGAGATPAPPAGGGFSFAPPGGAFGGAAGGATPPTQQQAASQPAPAGQGSPYGTLPAPPSALPPASSGVGLSQRGPAGFSPGGGGWGYAASPPPRIPALAVPRTLTPRPGSRMRPGRAVSHLGASGRGAAAGPEATPSPRSALPGPAASPGAGMFAVAAATSPCDARGSSATPDAPAPGGLFAPRDDPRRLFVRDALPSTAAGAGPGFVAGVLPAPRTPRPAPGEGGAGVSPAAKRGGSGAADDRADVANGDAGDNSAAAASPHSAHRPDSDPDATLAGLLPRLTRPDYYTVPSLAELAAAARSDPAAAAAVPEFVIGRRGLGSVAWLEPVDVRGLDLDDVITISRGGVEVYLEGPAKPPVGAGLNRPAEVTMLKIFKTDKATGQPVTNAAAVESFTRKLKRVTAEQGAQFVSYDPRTGTWRFTVEHFSRYGLFDDEDDDEDDEEGRSGDHGAGVGQEKPTPVGPASARRGRRRQVVDSDGEGGSPGAADPDSPRGLAGARPPPSAGLGLAWEEDDEEEREDMQQSDGASVSGEASDESFGGALARFVPGGRAQDFGGAPTLVTSLPARVGASEPEDLQRIGEGLFGATQSRGSGIARPGRAAARRGTAAGTPAGRRSGAGAYSGPAEAWGQLDAVAAVPVPADPAPLRKNNWVRTPPALLPPPAHPAAGALPSPEELALASPGLAEMPGPRRVPTGPATAQGHTRCRVGAHPVTPAADAADRADPARWLGRSWRAGWAPSGLLAHPGGSEASAAHLVVECSPSARAGVAATKKATHLEALLRIHLRHSVAEAPGGPSAEPTRCPSWRLACPRTAGLRALTADLLRACGEAAAGLPAGPQRTALGAQAAAWELLHVLFGRLEGEVGGGGPGEAGCGAEDAPDADGLGARDAPDADGLGARDAPLRLLVDLRRRAALSDWLRDRARAGVKRDLEALRASGARGAAASPAAVLALLTGRQLAAAASAAAAAGDVRLATLVAQAGNGEATSRDVAAQREVWRGAGFEPHLDATRALCYALVAGDVDGAARALDWRRALGLHLWYGTPPDAPLAVALEAYRGAVERGAAPPPLPAHVTAAGAVPPAVPATDAAWELLQLHAGWREAGAGGGLDPWSGDAGRRLAPLLRRLARPAGWSPDATDAAPGWLALCALLGAGVLSADDDEDEESAAAAALARASDGLIAQLEAAGRPAWAVYVAACLPRGAAREAAVRALLGRHAAAWRDGEARAFLTRDLRVPAAWVASALATLARAEHDHEVRLARLLEAGAWREAHDVLCAHVAAGRLLAGGGEEGGREAGVGQAIHAGTGRGPASPRPTFAAAPVSLSHALETLAPHATAIDGWEAGAGAYVRHLALRAAHVGQARSTGGGSDGAEALRGARVAQAAALAAAQERWGLAGAGWSAGRAGRGDAARRQAALALMASELGGWELADGGEAAPAPAQALAAAQLPAQTGLRLSCSVQLAAAALAERWSEPA
ncbi:NUP189 [Auxenochlorella protothecoides x Auxenochlorella symbiontica]